MFVCVCVCARVCVSVCVCVCVCVYYVIQDGPVRELFGLLILWSKYENKAWCRKALISLSLQTYHSTPQHTSSSSFNSPTLTSHLPPPHSQYFLPLSEAVMSVRFNLVQGSTEPWGGGRNPSFWVCLCVCVMDRTDRGKDWAAEKETAWQIQ